MNTNQNTKKKRVSKPFFSFSMYEKTGVMAIDMTAEFIAHERHFGKPLKTVYLRKDLFIKFRDWLIKAMGERAFWEAYAVRPVINFDDVEIKEASGLMLKPIYCDYYKDKMN